MKNIQGYDKDFSVGFFLALRDIRRSNPWTTSLIITVMTLTFFNMLFVGGILIGLVSGLIEGFRQYYSGDVFISPADEKYTIEQTSTIISVAESVPTFVSLSKRYTENVLVESNYRNRVRTTDAPESVGAILVGIDPQAEDKISHLSRYLVEGAFLDKNDVDAVVIGKDLLAKYVKNIQAVTKKLHDVKIGTKIRLTVNGKQEEVTVKGIINTTNQIADTRVYMTEAMVRKLLGRESLNANEIAIDLAPGASDEEAKEFITANISNGTDVKVQTADDAVPAGSVDVKQTFIVLRDIVGFIALIVGAITIFIVIFVNAITRRKFIGILKGIGISSRAIQISYVYQALFYAVSGIIIGSIIIMGMLKPYFDIYPLQLPIAEGRLALSYTDLLIRAGILTLTAFISGFIPAWLVTKQNTLDAILGR
ncbi:MAG: FtsX-like permease family protein [Patescibacteria group bacterium]